jgi:hypothetical protein
MPHVPQRQRGLVGDAAQVPPSEAKTEAIEIFGLKLSALVDRQNLAQSLLLNKPTMRIPHTGGGRIPKGGAEEETLKAWVAYLTKLSDAQIDASIVRIASRQPGPAHSGALRRLTLTTRYATCWAITHAPPASFRPRIS